jgi:O-antigen/teichoic acid export membrane protein
MTLPFLKNLDHHMQEVVRGASMAFLLKTLATGLGFVLSVVLARLLGPEGVGLYFLALTVNTLAVVVGRMGLDNALVRFTASNVAANDWRAVKGVSQQGITLSLMVSVAVAGVIVVLAPWLAEVVFSEPALVSLIRVMALAIVPVSLFTLYAQLLIGLKKVKDAIAVQLVWLPALTVLGVIVLVPSLGVQGAVWAYLLASLTTLLIGLWRWRGFTSSRTRGMRGYFDRTKLFSSSIPLFWMSIFQEILKWSPTLMLGIWGTSADVGLFGVALRVAFLISFVLVAVNSVVSPKFAVLYNQGDMVALGQTARNSAKLMTLMAAPIFALFLIAPGWIMSIFGAQFSGGAAILSILALGQFVNVATGSVQQVLMMCGYEHLLRNVAIICAILMILLNLMLIPLLGVLGAALATASVMIFQNLLVASLVWRFLGIWTLPSFGRSLSVK